MNLEEYFSWASGNLVDNRNRGIFGEWIVGKALGVIELGEFREEWAAFDLLYEGKKIEIKTSAYSQVWNPNNPTNPKFGIEQQKRTWSGTLENFTPPEGWKGEERRSGYWEFHDPPQRTADVYIFCLHDPSRYGEFTPATNSNVSDMDCWKFWVIATNKLNSHVGSQKTIGLSSLNRITSSIGYGNLKTVVDNELLE